MSLIVIEKLDQIHFPQIHKIVIEITQLLQNQFEFNWPESELQMELEIASGLVAIVNGEVISFALFRNLEAAVEITVLGTSPSFQRRGCQSRLVEYIKEDAARQQKEVWLEVHEKNEKALAFYLSHAFKVVNRRKSYYRDQGAAVVMSWTQKL